MQATRGACGVITVNLHSPLLPHRRDKKLREEAGGGGGGGKKNVISREVQGLIKNSLGGVVWIFSGSTHYNTCISKFTMVCGCGGLVKGLVKD